MTTLYKVSDGHLAPIHRHTLPSAALVSIQLA